MKQYRKTCKVLTIDSENIVIETEDKNTIILASNKLPKFVQIGDLLRHCEHGFYDIVDDRGNSIFRL